MDFANRAGENEVEENMRIGHLRKSIEVDSHRAPGGIEVDSHREIALRQPLNDIVCAEFQVERTGDLATRRGGPLGARPPEAEYRKLRQADPGGGKETVLDVSVRTAVAAGERSRV